MNPMRKLAVLVLASFLAGCATTPTAEQQALLEVSTKIAIRHFLNDPRAAEKAGNIRVAVARVQGILTAESTVGALTDEVRKEIDKLDLSPIQRADAHDLLTLLSVSLESRVGEGQLSNDAIVKTREFLAQVLAVLPAA
jgi:outer membrane PBP1 activator LpoA protein